MSANNQIGQNPRDNISGACGVVFALSFVLFLFGSGINYYANESFLVAGLFALPVLAQLIGLTLIYWKPRKHISSFSTYYACMMAVCVSTTYALWMTYNLKSSPPAHGLFWSVLALSSIGLIAGFVVVMTIAIMRIKSPNDSLENESHNNFRHRVLLKLINLKFDVQKEPFLALLLFFSAFLCVSYLFGLGFAFYDKTLPKNGKPALFLKNVYSEKNEGAGSSQEGQISEEKNAALAKIYFSPAKAVPDIEDFDTGNIPPGIWKQRAKEIIETVNRRKHNLASLTQIAKRIEDDTKDDGRIQIVLTGRADDTSTTGTPYSSNYELSQARAQNVQMKILDKLKNHHEESETSARGKWLNIEWVILPLSNEPAVLPVDKVFSSQVGSVRSRPKTEAEAAENRVVEIRIEPVSDEIAALQMEHMHAEKTILPYKYLDLMDYVYFANYTITTTGYGDIIPTTQYVKFLCSLANIFEVFFLVVFFNTLLSLKNSGGSTQAQIAPSEAPPQRGVQNGSTGSSDASRSVLDRFSEWLRPTKLR